MKRRGKSRRRGATMQWINSKTRYGTIPQIVHWLTVLCIGVGWLLGWFIGDFPKAAHSAVLAVHMTLGQSVIALLVLRLAWRVANPPPPPEKTRFGRLQERAATLSHFVLYTLLLAVPFAGIIVQLKRGDTLPVFGLWHVPSPWPIDRAAGKSILKVHEYLANTLVALAGLHAAAALVHHFVFRDRTLVRMVPGSA
jgi:cytochrome b561